MNYIHKLQNEVKERDAELKAVREALGGLREYLLSGKFRCGDELDGYVSTQDILNRLPQ